MSDQSEPGAVSPWPIWPWLPWMAAFQGAGSGFSLAPGHLEQAINPGWVFAQGVTINNQNSSAPEVEREIVSEESYGRQIGRILDAVAVLIAERPAKAPQRPELDAFEQLRERVEQIKARAALSRVDLLVKDLTRIKRDDPEAYERIVKALRDEP